MLKILTDRYKEKFMDNFYTLWHIYFDIDDDICSDNPLGMPWIYKGFDKYTRHPSQDSEEYFFQIFKTIEGYVARNKLLN